MAEYAALAIGVMRLCAVRRDAPTDPTKNPHQPQVIQKRASRPFALQQTTILNHGAGGGRVWGIETLESKTMLRLADLEQSRNASPAGETLPSYLTDEPGSVPKAGTRTLGQVQGRLWGTAFNFEPETPTYISASA